MNPKRAAAKYCANWTVQGCLGVMINKHLGLYIESKIAKKQCDPIKCKYFEKIVVPGISNGYK